jgi:hypothetical protein
MREDHVLRKALILTILSIIYIDGFVLLSYHYSLLSN